MADENTVEKPRRAARKPAEKIQPVAPEWDKSRDDWGMRIIPDDIVEKAQEEENPLIDGMRRIIGDSGMHRRWIALPLPGKKIAKAAAFATAKAWRRVRVVDGKRYQFEAQVIRMDNAESGQEWNVAVRYDPDKTPAPRAPRKPKTTTETTPENDTDHHPESVAETMPEPAPATTETPVEKPVESAPVPTPKDALGALSRFTESVGEPPEDSQLSFDQAMRDLRGESPQQPRSFPPQVDRHRPDDRIRGPRIA